MNNKKIVSLLLAVIMIVGIFVPAAVSASSPSLDLTDIVIHKIKLESLVGWPKTDGDYDGTQIENITYYFGPGAVGLNGVSFTYWKVDDQTKFDEMMANPGNFKTREQVLAHLNDASGIVTGETDTVGGQDGILRINGLEKGNYWFIENPGATLPDGQTLSGAAAVPFGLVLPLLKADGGYFGTGGEALHLYPKNTVADRPKVDKDFEDQANPDSPADPKETRSYDVGDIVPYEIKTIIPAGAQYQTAYWSDIMTEGLTFNTDSASVTIGGQPAIAADYELTPRTNPDGFKLELTTEGLKKINGQTDPVEIVIKYTATLNEHAVVDIPESNDVTFHYGNNPSNGNTPIPTKPKDGNITVSKSWAVTPAPTQGEIKFTLINANTGEMVDVTPNPVTLPIDANMSHTWTGLDPDYEYKVIEEYVGYTPQYGVGEEGEITIINHKEDNPEPVNPEEPKVVSGGKKFIKKDEKGTENLSGAEFVIADKPNKDDADTKYLALKDPNTLEQQRAAYIAAEEAYQKGVAGGANDLATLKKARDDAYIAANMRWTWVDDIDDAYVLTSSESGRFSVVGLKYATYYLQETKAPEGYALLTTRIPFTVGEGTYANGPVDIDGHTPQNEQIINNKKVTIPETGGIGSAVFVVAGLALMGTSAFVYKKRQADEE